MNQSITLGQRVLIVCSHYWPSSGGLESRMGQFARELVKAGYDVTVLTQTFPGRESDSHFGVAITSIPSPEFPVAIRLAVASGSYGACILVQDPLGGIIWSVEGLEVPVGTRLLIQPIINEDGYSRWGHQSEFSLRLANILKSADAALVMTRSGPDTLYMKNAGIDAFYLPNATVPVSAAGDYRERYGIPRDRFLILHVANLYRVKNHIGLMDALEGLPRHWQLMMVGHKSGEPDYVAEVEAKLATRPDVLFIPGLSREWTAAAMQAADVVVLASLGEGSPNTILEAMSQRKPWLATPECGAANDHLGGILCPLERFRAHLEILAGEPVLRETLGRIGYAHWQQCYNWPVVLQGWVELIETGGMTKQYLPAPSTEAEMHDVDKRIKAALAARVGTAPEVVILALVSVIVATYNRPEFLARCLASILRQTYPALEVIVVNDGGRPVEDVILRNNGAGNVHYLAQAANRGAAAARNSGLHLARGKYVAYLDDDDEYLPEHLALLVGALETSSCRFAYGRAEYLIDGPDDVPVQRQRPFYDLEYSRDLLLIGNYIPTPTWVFERSLVEDSGFFDESFKAWEDWEWLLRASEHTEFLSIAEITVEVHQRPHDGGHLGTQHRPDMRKWFERVYALHPASTTQLEVARLEQMRRLFPDVPLDPATAEDAEAVARTAMNAGAGLGILELIERAGQLVALQRADLAIALYGSWLKVSDSPLRFAAAYNLAIVLDASSLQDEAEQAFRRALAYKNDFVPARFGLALKLEHRGQLDEAQAQLRWICQPENRVAEIQVDLYEKALSNLQRLQRQVSA